MLNRLTHTNNDRLLALQRIVLAIVYFPHGAQKLLGWFGGYGLANIDLLGRPTLWLQIGIRQVPEA